MGAGLVGHDVHVYAAVENLGEDRGSVSDKPDRKRSTFRLGGENAVERIIEVMRHLVEVSVVNAALDTVGVDIDDEYSSVIERHGERLCATHTAASTRERNRTGESPVELFACNCAERLVCSLKDSLRSNVDPRTRGHLTVHREPFSFELAELWPVRPVADEVRVGDEYPRRPLVRGEDSDGLARLHEECLVRLERIQCGNNRIVRVPVARCTARAPVNDEIVWSFGDLGVKVVHQHALGCFG